MDGKFTLQEINVLPVEGSRNKGDQNQSCWIMHYKVFKASKVTAWRKKEQAGIAERVSSRRPRFTNSCRTEGWWNSDST
jgi:hypothetical protein